VEVEVVAIQIKVLVMALQVVQEVAVDFVLAVQIASLVDLELLTRVTLVEQVL
jgi:hypothetical protein